MVRDDLLLFFQELSDRDVFSPLHLLARAFYRGPLRALVENRVGSEVLVRHSVLNGQGFNLFSSDVDCTVLLPEKFTLQEIDLVREKYYFLKRPFPMLGEVEFFTKAEWGMLQSISGQYGSILQLLRDLKKIRWMEHKLAAPVHPYHASKARRAISRIIKKYEPAFVKALNIEKEGNHRFIGKGFSKHFRNLVPVEEAVKAIETVRPASFSFYSKEVGATVGCSGSSFWKKPVLDLNVDVALCLLSLYPSHEDDAPEILKLLSILRQTPQIRPIYLAILRHDLIYANASPRVHIQFRNTSWQWTVSLLSQYRAEVTEKEYSETISALNYHPSNENGFL